MIEAYWLTPAINDEEVRIVRIARIRWCELV